MDRIVSSEVRSVILKSGTMRHQQRPPPTGTKQRR
jgi:hypothetical protein